MSRIHYAAQRNISQERSLAAQIAELERRQRAARAARA